MDRAKEVTRQSPQSGCRIGCTNVGGVRPALLTFGVLVCVIVAFFWPLFTGRYWLPRGGGDLVSFLWPMYRFAARSIRTGVIPLWNPHLYSGAPFAADNQSGLFYPINLLLFLVYGEPSYLVMEALVVFHILLAGMGMLWLLRDLTLEWPSALFGAIAFALSDVFVTHIGNLNLNATAAWLPLLMLLTRRAYLLRNAEWAVGAGVVLAIAALAGHAQMLLMLVFAWCIYLMIRWVANLRCGWKGVLCTLGLATLILVIGMGGAALMLLPARELMTHTGRSHLPYADASQYSLPWRALIGLIAPGFYGRGVHSFWGEWERVEVGYLGVSAFALALLGAGLTVRSSLARMYPQKDVQAVLVFFVVLVPLAFALALGRYTPLYYWLYLGVPGFSHIRAPARFVLLGDFGLAGLAAYALDQFQRDRVGPRFRRCVGMAGCVTACLCLAAGLLAAHEVPAERLGQARLSIVVAALLFMLTGMLVLVLPARRIGWVLASVLAVELIALGSTIEVEENDPTRGFGHSGIVEFLRSNAGLYRIDGSAGAWQPSAALVHGLYDIGGVYNPLALAPYEAYRWAVGGRNSTLYDLLGVRYVIRDKGRALGNERMRLAYEGDADLDVYQNVAALPRAFLVYRALVVPDHASAWEVIHSQGFDPLRIVVLESQPVATCGLTGWVNGVEPPFPGQAEFTRYEVNNVEISVNAPVNAFLFVSDVYYPGWRAYVDGRLAPLLRADYIFRAVPVPPGVHVVRMAFTPQTWQIGLAVSGITWGGVSLWAGVKIGRWLKRSMAARGRRKRAMFLGDIPM